MPSRICTWHRSNGSRYHLECTFTNILDAPLYLQKWEGHRLKISYNTIKNISSMKNHSKRVLVKKNTLKYVDKQELFFEKSLTQLKWLFLVNFKWEREVLQRCTLEWRQWFTFFSKNYSSFNDISPKFYILTNFTRKFKCCEVLWNVVKFSKLFESMISI